MPLPRGWPALTTVTASGVSVSRARFTAVTTPQNPPPITTTFAMRTLLAGRKAEKGRSETPDFHSSAATRHSRTNITVGTWRANRGNARGVIPKRKPSMTDLPLRALVAFAARCALRVEFCLHHYDFASHDP